MTNNEVIMHIYKNINIKGICFKLGANDLDEIQQEVYERILRYDNGKLNSIFNNGAMLSFVYITTRNCIYEESRALKRVEEYVENEYMDEPYDDTIEDMYKFLDEEFKTVQAVTVNRMTYDEQVYFINKMMLKHKIYKKLTLDDIKDKFNISRNLANDCIQNAKKQLRDKYNKKTQS